MCPFSKMEKRENHSTRLSIPLNSVNTDIFFSPWSNSSYLVGFALTTCYQRKIAKKSLCPSQKICAYTYVYIYVHIYISQCDADPDPDPDPTFQADADLDPNHFPRVRHFFFKSSTIFSKSFQNLSCVIFSVRMREDG